MTKRLPRVRLQSRSWCFGNRRSHTDHRFHIRQPLWFLQSLRALERGNIESPGSRRLNTHAIQGHSNAEAGRWDQRPYREEKPQNLHSPFAAAGFVTVRCPDCVGSDLASVIHFGGRPRPRCSPAARRSSAKMLMFTWISSSRSSFRITSRSILIRQSPGRQYEGDTPEAPPMPPSNRSRLEP
jgi:hypothetical protein